MCMYVCVCVCACGIVAVGDRGVCVSVVLSYSVM